MSARPERLDRFLESIALLEDRNQRIDFLIDLADRFRPVPESIAVRPYPEERRVPACESEAYVFETENPDGTLDYHFAVENPQGVSAKALAVILGKTLSGAPLDHVAGIDPDLVLTVFGSELSMGKALGLSGMVAMVRAAARRRLAVPK